jgi:hypothetical protein
MGIWGRGLIPTDLRDSPTVDEAIRLELQHRLIVELIVGSFTGTKTSTMESLLASAHWQVFINTILPIISTKLRNPSSSGYTQQTCS